MCHGPLGSIWYSGFVQCLGGGSNKTTRTTTTRTTMTTTTGGGADDDDGAGGEIEPKLFLSFSALFCNQSCHPVLVVLVVVVFLT